MRGERLGSGGRGGGFTKGDEDVDEEVYSWGRESHGGVEMEFPSRCDVDLWENG